MNSLADGTNLTVRTPTVPASAHPFARAWTRQVQVLHAIMLHDIKSRFFGNGLGYIVTILWPSIHIAIIVGIFYVKGTVAPYGNDRLLYACIGVLPYVMWNYISRFTHLGLTMNKSFLQYPIIKPLDIMIARQALELVSSTIIIAGMIVVLVCCGTDVMPHRLDQAFFAILSAAFLGIGFGILGGVIVMIFPLFNVVYVLVLVGFWFTAGLVVDPESMPTELGNLMAWNPLLHCVEWLRSAYYDDFPARLLDKTYVFGVAGVALTLGLVLERALRYFTTR